MRLVLALLVAALLGLAGCPSPDYGNGGFSCAKDGVCPGGYVCVTEATGKFCRKPGTPGKDAALEGKVGDGKPDAPGDGPRAEGPRMEMSVDGPVIFDCKGKADGECHGCGCSCGITSVPATQNHSGWRP